MKQINSILLLISTLLFFSLLGSVYAVLSDINPILPLNILLWIVLCFLLYKAFSTIKWGNTSFKLMGLILNALLITYIIYGVKSCYFVSYYNELYLTGHAGIIPSGYTDSILPTLLDINIYIEKLDFMLGWSEISISFGFDLVVHLGYFVTNVIRLIEILGFFVASYLFTRIFNARPNS